MRLKAEATASHPVAPSKTAARGVMNFARLGVRRDGDLPSFFILQAVSKRCGGDAR
jgi:hypothetical protein